MDNTNNEIFIIITGEYSDMSVHSAWTDEAEANAVASRLNAAPSSPEAYVESYPLNRVPERDLDGWVGTYDCDKHGYTVDVKNIDVKRAIVSWYSKIGHMTWKNVAYVTGSTEEQVHKKIFDIVAQAAAAKAEL
jgi:hypothetical protein